MRNICTDLYEKKQSPEQHGAMFCLEKEEMGTYICTSTKFWRDSKKVNDKNHLCGQWCATEIQEGLIWERKLHCMLFKCTFKIIDSYDSIINSKLYLKKTNIFFTETH